MREFPISPVVLGGDQSGIAAGGRRGQQASRPRRTLGLCAHCGQPVEFGEEYVRLHRRAWHLNCALAAERPSAAWAPPRRSA